MKKTYIGNNDKITLIASFSCDFFCVPMYVRLFYFLCESDAHTFIRNPPDYNSHSYEKPLKILYKFWSTDRNDVHQWCSSKSMKWKDVASFSCCPVRSFLHIWPNFNEKIPNTDPMTWLSLTHTCVRKWMNRGV